MATQPDSSTKPSLPTAATFSFEAPLPTLANGQLLPKQRRVSLALPSSPRLFPAWSFRDDTGLDSLHPPSTASPGKKGKMKKVVADDEKPNVVHTGEKRQRKKWTTEETQMLVKGCNIWGVGNWKAILNDTDLVFDNRSPVDLKDRFRTFFPDAYKLHYPNAKTHLSSKIRSTLPDGTSLFEKTRSKKRRPFTPAEDQALRAGYEKHGTVWSVIVKDPIFQDQKRRSTDLRDRFRNAFPHLYQAAGYKPRSLPKKKRREDLHTAIRATDDQGVPTRHKFSRRLRAGQSQSLPQSAACSDDESSGDEEEVSMKPITILEATPQPEDKITPDPPEPEVDMRTDAIPDTFPLPEVFPQPTIEPPEPSSSTIWTNDRRSQLQDGWSSATTASPTSSQISMADCPVNDSPINRRSDGMNMMIGKSAWGPADWLSGNLRLDPSGTSSSNSSFVGGASPAPSSPFGHMSHGIMDRYDLSLTSFAHDFASEIGASDTHSTFSDPDMFPTQSFRGFTHHSDYAGDLIFGARNYQPQSHANYNAFGFTSSNVGLGLSGISQATASVNPLPMHPPNLAGIDELELTNIRLDDRVNVEDAMSPEPLKENSASPFHDDISSLIDLPPQTLEEMNISSVPPPSDPEVSQTPPATPVRHSRGPRELNQSNHSYQALHSRSISVPPFEHRTVGISQQLQSAAPIQPMRSMSFHENMSHEQPDITLMASGAVHPASSMDVVRTPGDLYDLSFLDLHYYAGVGMAPSPSETTEWMSADSSQALDLAATSQMMHSGHSLNVPRGMCVNQSLIAPPSQLRPHPYHHRGQSAISPKDLFLHRANDNKRKRVSWDGTAG